MKRTSVLLLLSTVYALSILCLLAQQTSAQPTADVKPAAAPKASTDSSDSQFVALLGKIAANRLARAKQINAAQPGTFTDDDITLLEQELKTTEALGKSTQDGKPVDWYAMLLGSAENSKTAAELDVKRVAQLRQQAAISPLDADDVQLRAQLTALNFERGKAAQAKSADDRQNWALQFLFVEMQSLQDDLRNLEERE